MENLSGKLLKDKNMCDIRGTKLNDYIKSNDVAV